MPAFSRQDRCPRAAHGRMRGLCRAENQPLRTARRTLIADLEHGRASRLRDSVAQRREPSLRTRGDFDPWRAAMAYIDSAK